MTKASRGIELRVFIRPFSSALYFPRILVKSSRMNETCDKSCQHFSGVGEWGEIKIYTQHGINLIKRLIKIIGL